MKSAGIADLKARLSEYLDQVKAGSELLITERGEPIAKLVPLKLAEERDSRRERLVRQGLLIPGRGRIRKELLTPPRGDKRIGAEVLKALIEERREGR